MKTKVAIIVFLILIVLIFMAWRKPSLEVEVKRPSRRTQKKNTTASKAPKSKAPNSREEKCRDIFETLTGEAYPTIRPNWLKNPKTGRKLELDGFNADLRSAFEHNGKQHYEYPNAFHKSKEEFLKLRERDEFKLKACKEHGIDVLVIPYDLEESQLETFIRTHLETIGVL